MSLQELKTTNVTRVPAAALDLVTNEFLTFRLGGEEYGIEILKVQEIRRYDSITQIANAPDYIKGVIKNPAASSGVLFLLRTTQADNPSVASDTFYLDFVHTCQSSAHLHAYQLYLQNNHPSKTLRPRASS